MNYHKHTVFFVLLTFLMLSVTMVSAWQPPTHDQINKDALALAPNSPVGIVIKNHWQDFIACETVTDYSVFFYFQQGFNTIGKVYLASHNGNICKRAVELAGGKGEATLACAYGVCAHEANDVPAHNEFVPLMTTRTYLPQGLHHAIDEQAVDNDITGKYPQLYSEVRSALINKVPVHREFLIQVIQSDDRSSTINVGNMIDSFSAQVIGNSKYSVGFAGFTAVPTSMHVLLIVLFIFCLVSSALLIRRSNKNIFTKILIGLLIFIVVFIIFLYVIYLTGNLWKTFLYVSTPLTWITPTSGWETPYNHAVQNTVQFLNVGANYMDLNGDPSGQQALADADAKTALPRTIVEIIFIGLLILFLWKSVRKR